MAANKKGVAVERLSPEELAEFVGQDDLTRTGRNLTEVRSDTQVIDRTGMTKDAPRPEPKVVETKIAGGTVMRSYASPDAKVDEVEAE